MPELPEVERAAAIARAALVGKKLRRARTLHPSQRRVLPDAHAESLAGDIVREVHRRGKHQLIRLASERTLHVHFRMNGDWVVVAPGEALPKYARVVFELDDGSALALDDSRALSSVSLHEAGHDPLPALGPEANDAEFSPTRLRDALTNRRTAIKVALLDQRVVAGIGNIYAAEALWSAKIDPRKRANSLRLVQLTALVAAVRRTLAKAFRNSQRYYNAQPADAERIESARFNVYDREGKPCLRCRTPIRRITQGARSTYFCPKCQR